VVVVGQGLAPALAVEVAQLLVGGVLQPGLGRQLPQVGLVVVPRVPPPERLEGSVGLQVGGIDTHGPAIEQALLVGQP
jgi:hypothetical protein